MEWICIIICLIGLIGWIVDRVSGGGDSSYDAGGYGLGDFRGRVRETTFTHDNGEVDDVLEFEAIGFLPHSYHNEELTVYINILDITDKDNPYLLLSTLDWQMEDESIVLLHRSALGPVEMDVGFTDWVSLGVAPIECTFFPWKGRRKFVGCFSLWPTNTNPRFHGGTPADTDAFYAFAEAPFTFFVKEEGYVERGASIKQARRYAIDLAMCMSSADGSLDQSEMNVINAWTEKMCSFEPESDKAVFQEEFKQLIDRSYQSAISGTLSLQEAVDGINSCAQNTEKFEAIELILDVMAADGVADKAELAMLDNITKCLELDPNQVRTLRDKRIASAGSITLDKGDLKSLVGINENMSEEEIRKHLNKEFQKWNSRATAGDEDARKRASEMLDSIAEARRRYLS